MVHRDGTWQLEIPMGITRRTFVISSATVCGGLALPSLASAAVLTKRPYIPYSADSFFKSGVEAAPVDEGRTRMVRTFMKNFPEQKVDYPRLNGVCGNKWGTAYAQGNPS